MTLRASPCKPSSTLIPDSEFVARAKLTVGEAWYQEGTTAALTQAETEFRDFITFFPNMPEAAEAQLKIADIHYRQMEKPDRDYMHARRAEDEYRQMLLQYPDSKLADTARVRLLEVQEVLAEREFRIAHFYYLRQSYLASIARAKTLTDTYPLYSRSDEALFMLGQAYEQQADRTRAANLPDALKQRLTKDYLDNAAEAYSKIVTRYPAMPRYQDARRRLAAIDHPVPTPTPGSDRPEQKGTGEPHRDHSLRALCEQYGQAPGPERRGQSRARPRWSIRRKPMRRTLVREINSVVKTEMDAKNGTGKVAVETVSASGKAPENQPAPRSADPAVSPNDVPAPAPSQLNESASSLLDRQRQPVRHPRIPPPKTMPKNASSSRKTKKKHHFHVPIPF